MPAAVKCRPAFGLPIASAAKPFAVSKSASGTACIAMPLSTAFAMPTAASPAGCWPSMSASMNPPTAPVIVPNASVTALLPFSASVSLSRKNSFRLPVSDSRRSSCALVSAIACRASPLPASASMSCPYVASERPEP